MKTGGVEIKRRWLRIVVAFTVASGAWAQSSETVAFSPASATFANAIAVTLSGAGPGQQIRYVVASGPGAVNAQVTVNSPEYSGPITVTNTSLIRAAVFSAGGSNAGRTTSGHYVKIGASLAGFASKLPVLVLDVLGVGPLEKDDINHQSWLFGFEPRAAGVFSGTPAFTTPLVASVRGSSSAEFPKKGYNIRMRDAAGRSRAFPIFDLPAYERWALVAPWAFDPTFINNAFVFALSNSIGRWAPRTKLVELFFNTAGDDLDLGDYGGIYVVTDRIRIEPGRVDIDELATSDSEAPAITGGYVLKIDPPDPDEISWLSNRGVPVEGPSEIVLVEPDSEDITPAQLQYIKQYVQDMEDALHADRATGFAQRTYLDYLDRSSWVDHHILNVFVNNPDALHRSAYFTKPRGGRLQAGPVWDFDRAVGGFWDDRTSLVDTWSGVNGAVDVWQTGWWGVLAEDPDFVQSWIDRWQSLRHAELSTPALVALAQGLADTIGVEAAQRDANRWPDSASPYGSYTAQIEFLKNWLTQRAAWIDSQFVPAPSLVTNTTVITITPPDGVWLAYTTDGSDPRDPGGDIATDAHLHAGSLVVPASTNLRVRSFNPAPREEFPSSRWSMAVEGVRVASFAGQGRIVNLSSKVNLGSAADSLIIGVVVADAPTKRYLVRAVGPGLDPFGVPMTLDEPLLVVKTSSGVTLARNSSWESDPSAAQIPALTASLGAFPLKSESADAATIVAAPTQSFTVEISSANGEPGAVLGELYEGDDMGRTANASILGRATSERPLTGGFVIAEGANRILIRAVGPTLGEFGVQDGMPDPTLTLRAGDAVIARNFSWMAGASGPEVEAASARAGAFPLSPGSLDAALVTNLPAGSYTVEVTPAGDGSGGRVLLEIYDLP